MAKSTKRKSLLPIELGSFVQDTITGFSGFVIGRTEFAYGCIHLRVQAKGLASTGEPIPAQSFDDQRIELLKPPAKSWPKPKLSRIALGDAVRDIITGISGMATGRSIALDGRISYIVEQSGLTDDGKPKEAFCVIGDRLEVVNKKDLKVSATSVATSGGPVCRGSYIE